MGRNVILMLVLICLIGGYVITQGARVDRAERAAQNARTEATRLAGELALERKAVITVTEYVDRVQVVRERGATITREVPVYVTAQSDARCPVPAGFVWLHDAAAQGVPLAAGAGDPDAPAQGVALSDVAGTVAGNYTTCHETAAQLTALQGWVRDVQALATP